MKEGTKIDITLVIIAIIISLIATEIFNWVANGTDELWKAIIYYCYKQG